MGNLGNFEAWVLEVGEIFDLSTQSMGEQSLALLKSIDAVNTEAAEVLRALKTHRTDRESWIAKLFGSKKKVEDPLMPVYKLGLGNWSNILCFQFDET